MKGILCPKKKGGGGDGGSSFPRETYAIMIQAGEDSRGVTGQGLGDLQCIWSSHLLYRAKHQGPKQQHDLEHLQKP